MKAIEINFSEETETLTIRGDIENFVGNAAIRAFLFSREASLKGSYVEYCLTKERLPKDIDLLERLTSRFGMEVMNAASASSALREIADDRELFQKFSEEAGRIWRADFSSSEFEEFSRRVGDLCKGRVLYPRQLLAAYHLAFSQNACNFSVPGAGKTSIVYAAFAYLNSLPIENPRHVNHVLVVGPLASFAAWETEFQEVFARKPRSKRIAGFTKIRDRQEYLASISVESRNTEISLTTYPSLYTQEDLWLKFFTESRRVMMVLDEAHYIKSIDGLWATSALKLSTKASSRVVLTGTPAPNGYEDLRNVFEFIWPGKNVIKFSGGALRAMTEGRLGHVAVAKLNNNVKPFYIRITKNDLRLPPVKEERVVVEMKAAQREIYEFVEGKLVGDLSEGRVLTSDALMRARLIRLRQAASNPKLLLKPVEDELGPFKESLPITDRTIEYLIQAFNGQFDSSRLDKVLDIVDTEINSGNKKILIWSYFLGNLDLLRESLGSRGLKVDVLSGATPVENEEQDAEDELYTREAIIRNFHSSKEPHILVANPQAVGESISLHKACHVAIYFDRDFNAGRFIQSKDRIHRVGLSDDQETRYYYLVSRDSIDESIDVRLAEKEERLVTLLESDEIPLFDHVLGDNAVRDDLARVLEDYRKRVYGGR